MFTHKSVFRILTCGGTETRGHDSRRIAWQENIACIDIDWVEFNTKCPDIVCQIRLLIATVAWNYSPYSELNWDICQCWEVWLFTAEPHTFIDFVPARPESLFSKSTWTMSIDGKVGKDIVESSERRNEQNMSKKCSILFAVWWSEWFELWRWERCSER